MSNPSPNGASSFHLWWQYLPPVDEIAVTLEVMTPPTVQQLYFWALQATLADNTGLHGGLQWQGSGCAKAVDWGGYGPNGAELAGTPLLFPPCSGNPNVGAYDWTPGFAYRLRIFYDVVTQTWQFTVNDQVVRGLVAPQQKIIRPVMWSEVFASCSDPQVAVRWRDLYARDGGTIYRPRTCSAAYQDPLAGGCPNTDSRVEGKAGFWQITNTSRANPPGTLLRLEEPMHSAQVQVTAYNPSTGSGVDGSGKGHFDTGIPYDRLADCPYVNGDPNHPPTTACVVQPCNFSNQIRLMLGMFTPGAQPLVMVPIWD